MKKPFKFIISTIVAPLFIVGVGITFVAVGLTTPITSRGDLMQINGTLESWDYRDTKGHTNVSFNLVGYKSSFSEMNVQKDKVALFLKEGVPFSCSVLLSGTPRLSQGYGMLIYTLNIDGHDVETLEGHIDYERKTYHTQFPLLGIFCIAMAVFIRVRNERMWRKAQ